MSARSNVLVVMAATSIACGSEKSSPAAKPFDVKCTVDRSGAATPSAGLLREGWNLHNRDKSSLRAPKLSCDITGPRNTRATMLSPPGQIRIESEGTDHFTIAIDKLDPAQKEIVLVSGEQRVAVPLALTPYFGEVKGELTEQGALVVSGTVYGAKEVTVAGKQVPVLDSKFSAALDPGAYLQEHLPLLATPLELVRSMELLLSAGEQPTAYASVTFPAPPFVTELSDALVNNKPIPQAAPLRIEAGRPTLAVVVEQDGKRLLATKDDIKLSEVELIANVVLAKVVIEKCQYVAEGTQQLDKADLPAERLTYAFEVTLRSAKDAREVGTGKLMGVIPPPCPDKLTASTKLDKKLFIGSIPSYADLTKWLREYVPSKPNR